MWRSAAGLRIGSEGSQSKKINIFTHKERNIEEIALSFGSEPGGGAFFRLVFSC